MNRQQRRAAKKNAAQPNLNKPATLQRTFSKPQRMLNDAISLLKGGRHEQAEQILRRAAELDPKHPEIIHYLGMSLFYQGKAHDALPIVGRSLNLRVDDPTFLSNFGVVAYSAGKLDLAISSCEKSLEFAPNNADALINLSAALNDCARFSEAKEAADRAIKLNPNGGKGAYLNRGNALKAMQRFKEAIADYHKAIEIDPDYANAHTMLGHAYDQEGELKLAEQHTRKGVDLAPNMFEAHNNLATVLMRLGKRAEANMHLSQSHKLNPNAKTLWNMALNMLNMRDFQQGIALYKFGFDAETRIPFRKPPMPRWQGEDISGKSILIWREQGVGDELRFSEWYHHVIALGARCVIEATPRFVSLFERSFPAATVMGEDLARDFHRSDADFHVAAGDLPAFFGLSNAGGNPGRFLTPDPHRARHWRERIESVGPGVKIGLCWRSGLQSGMRNFHYAQLDELRPILELPNTQFINLQYFDCSDELADFEQRTGIRIHSFDDLDQFNDLDETAAMTSGLDLVISAPTAVSQMSGALGVETWRFEAHGTHSDQPPVSNQWLQPNGEIWIRHWQEPWSAVMRRMAGALSQRLTNADTLKMAQAS